jgi:putative SOS response-associated peptidase YedK
MCGRYSLVYIDELPYRFDANPDEELNVHYNVAPGLIMPVITRNSPNKIVLMKWGLVPSWSKDLKSAYKMINARAEGISEKPAFRKAIRYQRCLIPASGFYEWKKAGDDKVPYYIQVKGVELFAFAGLYETWKDVEGKEFKTYAIITTEPNSLMEPIHNRMPVILHKKDEGMWLDKEVTDSEQVLPLLKPYPAKDMTAYVVSKAVNSPRNDTDKVIQPER